jgi:hypothetical protein
VSLNVLSNDLGRKGVTSSSQTLLLFEEEAHVWERTGMLPTGLETESHCTGEHREKFYRSTECLYGMFIGFIHLRSA